MEEVEKKLEESYKRKPRMIEVWYLNPEFPEVFKKNKNFWKLIRRDSLIKNRHGMHVFKNIF